MSSSRHVMYVDYAIFKDLIKRKKIFMSDKYFKEVTFHATHFSKYIRGCWEEEKKLKVARELSLFGLHTQSQPTSRSQIQ